MTSYVTRAVKEFGVPHEIKVLDFETAEHKGEDYLKVSSLYGWIIYLLCRIKI